MDVLSKHPYSSLGAVAILAIGLKQLLSKPSRAPYPPSPPSQLILGHAKILYDARGNEGMAFYELGKKYGPICYLNVLGMPMVIINDHKIASELLDKRGSIYSSRPVFAIAEVMGFIKQLAFLPYGQDWRTHRKIFQRYFRPDVRPQHQPTQLREARNLLRSIVSQSTMPLYQRGKDWEPEILRFATCVVIGISFGHETKSENDPYLKIADDMVKIVIPAMMNTDMLSAGLVQVFPYIQYFPSWFPGAYVPSRARSLRRYVRPLFDYPLEDVQKKLDEGTARHSFLATQLEELRNGESGGDVGLEDVKAAGGAVYTAGTETTASMLLTLLGALVLHPEVQKKAQKEIDAVVGGDRLPEYEDWERLPYLQCILQEIGRWEPVAPVQPRKTTEDDVYEGMYIPKGSVVIINARGMGLDESVYKDPTRFNPDRYLPVNQGGNGEPWFEPNFGYGRRICPGRYLATDSLWIVAAYLLATMDVLPAVRVKVDGEEEEEEGVRWKFMGTVNRPLPFRCRIVPRSEKAKGLVDGVEF